MLLNSRSLKFPYIIERIQPRMIYASFSGTPAAHQSSLATVLLTQVIKRILSSSTTRCPRGVMVKAMNCGIVVREFVLQSRYYVHFRANTLGKGMNPLILPPAMGK